MRTLDALPPQIHAWATASLGKDAATAQFTQFPGGANNLVFGCDAPGRKVVVKAYPQAANLSADRFQAETDFLTYANQVAAAYVPRLYETDASQRVLVMEFLEGTRFETDGDIQRADVAQAAAFLGALNADPARAATQIKLPAADGFLTLSAHISNVDSRVGELAYTHLPQTFQYAAQALITETRNRWDSVKQTVETHLAAHADSDELSAGERCVSPSDFGFHNAMRCKDGVKFYDFEFAGWDDPAKTVADFFLQPRISAPRAFQQLFEQALVHNISEEELTRRMALLRPLLQLKWVTIVLAVLRPARLQAMLAVAVDKNVSTLIEERFGRAQRLLSQGTA